jgi:SAM-dependent methyltransferase
MRTVIDVERVVNERYGLAAKGREPELCCAVEYDPHYLSAIPDEIKERDYGCGDPSPFVRRGDVVLDLGSGSGKICYIAAQIVGPKGQVIGVDANDEMLALARKYRQSIGERIGCHNTEFRKGRIQDLRLDLALVDSYLAENPVASAADLARFNDYCAKTKTERP